MNDSVVRVDASLVLLRIRKCGTPTDSLRNLARGQFELVKNSLSKVQILLLLVKEKLRNATEGENKMEKNEYKGRELLDLHDLLDQSINRMGKREELVGTYRLRR